MWVFGYGSLMWDGWEKQYNCLRRQVSQLDGYRRSFSKASVKNWGSPANPGPTLNIEADEHSSCIGIAFEFPDEQADEISSYLTRREGKGFRQVTMPATIEDGQTVYPSIPIYTGKNIVRATALAELARLVTKAKGTSGSCRDYVHGIHLELTKLGIADHVVSELWNEVCRFE